MAVVSDATPRPSHTTMAAGMVIGGSVLIVVTVAQQLSELYSLEYREAVAEFLARPPGSGLGLDVSDALTFLRAALMVVAGCATAAAVLGFHVLRRNRRARLGLTILAVPLFLGGLTTGGFLTSLVAAASMLLWLGPSRAWLDRTPLPDQQRRDLERRPQPTWPPLPPPGPTPGPSAGPGSGPPPHPTALGQPPASPPASVPRPDAVVWACVLTWAFSGLTLVLAAATATILAADPSLVWEELQRQDPQLAADSGLDRDSLVGATYVTLAVASTWCLAAIALAVLAFRRSAGGRLGLLICAAVAGLVSLLATLSSVVMLVPALACLATVILLVRPEVRGWVATSQRRP